MGSSRLARSFVYVVALLLASLPLLAFGRQAEHDPRNDGLVGSEGLFSSDPGKRGAAKAELLQHPDPALLPALLAAAPRSTGTIQDDIIEVLSKYNDPRKIPVLLTLLSAPTPNNNTLQIEEQLAALGAPAAQALLTGCDEIGNGYVASVLHFMNEPGKPFLVEAVLSKDSCRHEVGEQGLLWAFGDADAESVSRADVQLACDAAMDPDERIREATARWFATWKGKEGSIDFSSFVEALISAYQSGAPPKTMIKIAEMLSETERPRVTRFMSAAVHAPNPEIQRIANDYLLRFTPKASGRPVQAGSNPRSPKQKIDLLGRWKDSPDTDINTKILRFLNDPDASVRTAAVSALGSVNAISSNARDERDMDPAPASAGLRAVLKDASPQVRAAAVEALGMIHSDSNDDLESLIAALKDSDGAVVLAAAAALQQMPSDSAVPALTEIYRNERNSSDLRDQALTTLEIICNPDSIPIFLEDLRVSGKTPSFPAAMALRCALEKRPDPSAFEPIRAAIAEAQSSSLEALVVALGETKNPKALEVLVPLLKSPNPMVPVKAAEALGLLGDTRAIPLLSGLLKNSAPIVREAAAYALTRFANFAASPELIAALGDADTTVRIHAAKALVVSHDPKGIDGLIAAIPNSSAIYSLGEAHDMRAVPALIAFFQDPANKSADRGAAAASLGQLGDSRAVEPLIASLNEDNGTITMQASSALAKLKDRRAIEPLQRAHVRWSTGQRENSNSVLGFIVQALLDLGAKEFDGKSAGAMLQ